MEPDKNITGISENLADSISEKQSVPRSGDRKAVLAGRRIAISVSESEDIEQFGLSDQHLKDVSIELARYLLVNGATMLYGGDLRIGGFTRLYAELSLQYRYLSDRQNRFVNYFSFPLSNKVTLKDKADFIKQGVEARILEPPLHIGQVDKEREYQPFNSIEDRYLFAECLTDMRMTMAKESDARILVGGRQKNFLGYMPGIVEEAYHTLKNDKPLYILGGFGGTARLLIQLIISTPPKELTNDFQYDTTFLVKFKEHCLGKATIPIDYEEVLGFFRRFNLQRLSEKNGLSTEENQFLFESRNIHEIVFLILKGLKNVLN